MELENDARYVLDALEANVRYERKNYTECEPLDDAFADELDDTCNGSGGNYC